MRQLVGAEVSGEARQDQHRPAPARRLQQEGRPDGVGDPDRGDAAEMMGQGDAGPGGQPDQHQDEDRLAGAASPIRPVRTRRRRCVLD